MEKAEFLEILRSQLSEELNPSQVDSNMRYYDSYIAQEAANGKTEQEVIAQLGDPRLIARTIVDTSAQNGNEEYREASFAGQEDTDEKGRVHRLDLTTWYGKLIVILIAAGIMVLLVTILSALLPIILPLLLVCILVAMYRRRR